MKPKGEGVNMSSWQELFRINIKELFQKWWDRYTSETRKRIKNPLECDHYLRHKNYFKEGFDAGCGQVLAIYRTMVCGNCRHYRCNFAGSCSQTEICEKRNMEVSCDMGCWRWKPKEKKNLLEEHK